MERGTYTSASGGVAQLQRVEVINNNLANINTTGFKGELVVADTQSFDDTLASKMNLNDPYAKGDNERSPGIVQVRSVTDFTPGAIKHTGNPLDVALKSPNQFFVVQTPEGEQYTRAGDFTLDTQGQIVTPDGMPVVGDGGSIVTDGVGISITGNGGVRSNGVEQGRLRIAEFKDTKDLERAGGNRFKLRKGGAAPETVDGSVETGSLEMANVSTIGSVVELISANRGFELYTKTAQSIDQMNQSAITQVGKSK